MPLLPRPTHPTSTVVETPQGVSPFTSRAYTEINRQQQQQQIIGRLNSRRVSSKGQTQKDGFVKVEKKNGGKSRAEINAILRRPLQDPVRCCARPTLATAVRVLSA